MRALFTRGPHFLIYLFSPLYMLIFLAFKKKIGIYDLDLAQGTLFQAFSQWEGGV
jgi:hypothetical protein